MMMRRTKLFSLIKRNGIYLFKDFLYLTAQKWRQFFLITFHLEIGFALQNVNRTEGNRATDGDASASEK